jgi:hypothetical protein
MLISTKLLLNYLHDLGLLFSNSNICFFTVTLCVIVLHKVFEKVYNKAGIGNIRAIAKVYFGSCRHARAESSPESPTSEFFFQWCCQGDPSQRLKVLNN